MKVKSEAVQASRDARGLVFEPLGVEHLEGQRNVHVVLTEPGQVRGNHYHRRGSEVLVVLGPALVRIREEGEPVDFSIPVGAIQRFFIPPGIAHAIRNTGPEPGLLVGFNTEAHDAAQPDTFREVLLEP